MNIRDAYKILELTDDATKEEANEAFRRLSKLYHPDNKKTGDAQKFKEINEANQKIQNPEPEPQSFGGGGFPFGGFDFSGFGFGGPPRHFKTRPNVQIGVTVNFNDSVLGCDREIEYDRHEACKECSGDGFEVLTDSCDSCKGNGRTTIKKNNMVFMTTCGICGGLGKKTQECKSCSGEGTKEVNKKINIKLPGGLINNSKIRLAGGGHFMQDGFYSDAFINVKVIPDKDMTLDGNDVVSRLELSLLEALKGTKKKVRTVKGELTLKVKPKVRNGEKISASGYGANGGNHIFILDVQYPEDVSKLINVLDESEPNLIEI